MNMITKNMIAVICLSLVFTVNAQERNLQNLKKLTFGGDNAEAYFSPNSQSLTMQVTYDKMGLICDQIYMLDWAKSNITSNDLKLISTGKGRTTCSYFMPDGKHILYASTHEAADACPPTPKPRKDGKYLWAIYSDFDIYVADLNGNIIKKLTNSPGYDAEATVSPDGKKIVFTSMRSGDLELWTMDIDGNNLKQITFGLGYDGGAFFSHDSKKLVFRASRPNTEFKVNEYKELLKENLVMPVEMELYTCNVDGSNLKQVTHLGKANWAPYFTPNDDRIIFSSNHHSTKGYDFQLYTVDTNGNNIHQITFESNFNAFAMFSPDGKKIAFSSNRQQEKPRETNVFIADWIDEDIIEIANKEALKKHIYYLASDKLQGRLTGSKGEKLAAKYIQQHFKKLHLNPLIDNNFNQKFSYHYNPNPHDSTNATSKEITGNNVVAFLNNNAQKTILIGAHYDHLGFNEHNNSTNPNATGQIHNGADDNASGVATVLELASMFTTNKIKENVNIIFACFSGEEDGLMGSKELANYLSVNKIRVDAMINLDMVGRLDSLKALIVGGIGTSPSFGNIIEKNKPAGFNITLDSSGVGPTDHTSFYLKNYPVLNFFTGTHSDYHKPTDDAEKINYDGIKTIAEYIYRISFSIAEQDTVLFTKTKTIAGKSAPKYKVTLGIMPDYKDYGDGLHIDAVTDNRAAQKAGLIDGDILLKINDCEIKEIYSYMECLTKFKTGDTVIITYKRKDEIKTTTLTF